MENIENIEDEIRKGKLAKKTTEYLEYYQQHYRL